jgi:hypothetical protein
LRKAPGGRQRERGRHAAAALLPGRRRHDPAAWEPDTTVIYTPNLPAPGYPDDRVIVVDLTSNVTRVLNSDYFGESKKGGLWMWNTHVEIIQPRRLYERHGRIGEYDGMMARLKREREEYLSSFAGLDEAIVKSIG